MSKDYTFVTRLDHGHPVECHICGISSFDHLHRAGTKPKDFERLEEEITTGLVDVEELVTEFDLRNYGELVGLLNPPSTKPVLDLGVRAILCTNAL